MGPRIEPWGTPHLTVCSDNLFLPGSYKSQSHSHIQPLNCMGWNSRHIEMCSPRIAFGKHNSPHYSIQRCSDPEIMCLWWYLRDAFSLQVLISAIFITYFSKWLVASCLSFRRSILSLNIKTNLKQSDKKKQYNKLYNMNHLFVNVSVQHIVKNVQGIGILLPKSITVDKICSGM